MGDMTCEQITASLTNLGIDIEEKKYVFIQPILLCKLTKPNREEPKKKKERSASIVEPGVELEEMEDTSVCAVF